MLERQERIRKTNTKVPEKQHSTTLGVAHNKLTVLYGDRGDTEDVERFSGVLVGWRTV
jgi:hypothetical protein